ncbi:MAG: phytoene desaturase family protein [Solirubrobacteraceae bacterium]
MDVIVIGAGHNGLVAACYLQRAGLDVLVLECNDWIGGCTSTASLVPGAPNHMINPCAQDFCLIRLSSVVQDLELRRYGYREKLVDPAYVAPLDDGSTLAFWRDPVVTAQELAYFDKRDARAYLKFLETLEVGMEAGIPYLLSDPTRPPAESIRAALKGGVRHPRAMAEMARIVTDSAAEVIDARFRHPVVRGGLLSLAAVGAPVTHKGSGINAMFPAIVRHAGVSRPIGGAQILPDALAACLRDYGGTLRTAAEVTEVLVANGRATGVRLASGEELRAGTVISAMDPAKVLSSMLPAGSLPERIARRVAKIPSENGGAAYLTVHMAFSARLSYERLQARRRDDLDLRNTALLAGSFDEMVAAVDAATSGRMPDPMPFAAVLPTGPDPSQAPGGQDTIYLWAGWAPRRPPEGWDALADKAGQAMVDQAKRYIDGFDELELGRFVETWPILQERTHVPNGNPYYVDLLFARNGPMRPALGLGGYTTPIPGLYLTGGGTHPGPSVSGIPGQLTAKKVLASIKDLSFTSGRDLPVAGNGRAEHHQRLGGGAAATEDVDDALEVLDVAHP